MGRNTDIYLTGAGGDEAVTTLVRTSEYLAGLR